MCHRVICQYCGKYTWEGCGLHIAQALAGLSLEQICSCDDDQDSEHSWASITSPAASGALRYPLPYSTPKAPKSASLSSLSTPNSNQSVGSIGNKDGSSSAHCIDPSPVEYKLSKISSTSAAEAAVRKAQQAAALEELKRRKDEQQRELKDANQDALQRLLEGLAQASTTETP
ncbi:hypothetical protein BGZ46_002231 [Entomortierella lignicola]|nr:hypothetical protein BGZ46_002231 [Entomortierella lignicola]